MGGSSTARRRKYTRGELATRGLRQMVAELVIEVEIAIDHGLDTDGLYNVVGLWSANNLTDGLTYESLVDSGRPTVCDDCGADVTPHDDQGFPIGDEWEWYMVTDEVWASARRDGDFPKILCIACLEHRLGRRLVPNDFPSLGMNEPGGLASFRLCDRLGHEPLY